MNKIVAILCLLFICAAPVAAAELDDALAATDRKLVLQLVRIAKFNANFQLEANRHQRWRALTYPLGREAGTAMTFAATIIDMSQQARGLHNPRRIDRGALKNAVRCGITGSAISGSASSLELAQNTWVMLQARRKGYSPARSIAFVKEVIANTDTLLAQRETIGAQLPAPRSKDVAAETSLVRRIRQQLVAEFCMWSAHSRDQAWRENTFYAIDAGQSFTRMGAGILARAAFEQPRLARPSVICALISASAATVNPIVRNLVGFAVRRHQEHRLANEFSLSRPTPTIPETDTLSADHAGLTKLALLTDRSAHMDGDLDRQTRLIERYRQVAQQQSISGPLIGLTGVTSATLGTVAVYGHARHPETAIQLGFGGRISQSVGQGYALLNTPYTAIKGALRKRDLASRGLLPRQILQERLKHLDELEQANQ